MSRRISVLVAYRYALLRESLQTVLSAEADLVVVGQAANGKQALEMAEQLRPEIVLMDAHLPIVSGVEAAALMQRGGADARVVLLVETPDDRLILDMLRAGVSSCLLQNAEVPELLAAIRTAHRGGSYLSPAIAQRVAHNYVRYATDSIGPTRSPLSLREREVLQLVADGVGNTAIASALSLSVKTVEAHKAHISKKLGVRGQTALIRYAVHQGLLDLEMTRPADALASVA